jgi:hypothetical protein
MVVDSNGLALALKGSASEKAAGASKLLVERAKKLGEDSPSVCIETDSGSILLEEQQNTTIVLYRSNERAAATPAK